MVTLRSFSICCLLSFAFSLSSAQTGHHQFEGVRSSITFDYQYPYASLYDYRPDASGKDSLVYGTYGFSCPEQILAEGYVDEFSKNSEDNTVFELLLRSKLAIEIDRQDYRLIKYKTVYGGNRSGGYRLIVLKETGGVWEEEKSLTPELETLRSIMVMSSANLLFLLFGEGVDPEHPEIDGIRPLVKNRHGHLDIKKLHTFLMENKGLVSKYAD